MSAVCRRRPGAAARRIAVCLGLLAVGVLPEVNQAVLAAGFEQAPAQRADKRIVSAPRPSSPAAWLPQDAGESGVASRVARDTAEARLESIRHALLAHALEAPTRVLSIGWIDERGALQEATQFSTQAYVRGVRVLGYLEDAKGPGPHAAGSSHPKTIRDVHSSCEGEGARWRMPLSLRIVSDQGLRGQQRALASMLLDRVRRGFEADAPELRRWHYVRLQGDEVRSSYRHALVGGQPDRVDWQLDLGLERVARPQQTRLDLLVDVLSGRRGRTGEGGWRLTWTLRRVGLEALALRLDQEIREADSGVGTEAGATSDGIAAALTDLFSALDKAVGCDAVEFTVARDSTDEWSMPVGFGAGFRVGDQVLVFNRARGMRRLLEPGGLQMMGLAEVRAVSERQVKLRQLAGPVLRGVGDWVAIPI